MPFDFFSLFRTDAPFPNSQISRFFSNPSIHASNDIPTIEQASFQTSDSDKISENNLNYSDENEQTNKNDKIKESLHKKSNDAKQVHAERKKLKNVQRNDEISQSDSKPTIKSFFSNDNNDSLSDFEIPTKVAKRVPKILPSKTSKTSRSRRKQPDIRKALGKRNAKPTDYSHLPENAQLELALAMSKAESNAKLNEEPFSLESYQFKPTNAKANGEFFEFFNMPKKKTARFKWNSKCTQLTRRKNDTQKSKIHDKIDEILMNNIIVESSQREKTSSENIYFELPDYTPLEIYSRRLQRICISERILFELNGCVEHSSGNYLSYYTNNLVERSEVGAGVLLRDWSKIAGRDSIYDGIKCSSQDIQETDTNKVSSQPKPEAGYYDEQTDIAHCSGILKHFSHSLMDSQKQDKRHEVEHSKNQNQDTSNHGRTNDQMENQYGVASSDDDADATVVMDSNDIQLKVDAINSKIRLSQNFCDIFQPAIVTYEFSSSVRAPSPDLFDDDDDIDMANEIRKNNKSFFFSNIISLF